VHTLITGASGFAGSWLARACVEAGEEVFALSRRGTPPHDGVHGLAVNLLEAEAVRNALATSRPQRIFHLAALSSVGRSWERPAETMAANVSSATNLLEAVREKAPEARLIWISTCEVYGVPEALPIPESAPVRPANPYAVSKAAAEMLAHVYADAHGLDIVCARPFSHSGPGQRPIFLLSSLARQAAEGRRAGQRMLRIVTGNPDTRRDFTDVRDVVEAYRHLAGSGTEPTYNVSSGESISAGDQVALLAELLAPMEVEHVVDPGRVRVSEVMDLRGDHSLLTRDTGWNPSIPLRQTMSDTIGWWEKKIANEIGT
jgi:GDP-4-dehydro-6-deoxy-D-mannose reductase